MLEIFEVAIKYPIEFNLLLFQFLHGNAIVVVFNDNISDYFFFRLENSNKENCRWPFWNTRILPLLHLIFSFSLSQSLIFCFFFFLLLLLFWLDSFLIPETTWQAMASPAARKEENINNTFFFLFFFSFFSWKNEDEEESFSFSVQHFLQRQGQPNK